jgi:hypothetical protein
MRIKINTARKSLILGVTGAMTMSKIFKTPQEKKDFIKNVLNKNKENRIFIFKFGKHKGKRIDQVPLSYLVWVYDNEVITSEDAIEAIGKEIDERTKDMNPSRIFINECMLQ